MKEWHRTVVLLILLALAVGFLVWSQIADSKFVGSI
jgi:hypothetical protein